MRTFKLQRFEDVSGVSGTGLIAEGVEFHDGQVVVSWFGRHHTLEVAASARDVIEIHGHGGKTVLVWDKDQLQSMRRKLRVMKGIILSKGGK